MNWNEKKPHGGARKGAGRKPKEPTVVMRIPVSKVNAVLKIILPKGEPLLLTALE